MKKNLIMVRAFGMALLLFISLGSTALTAEAKEQEKESKQKVVVINPGCQAIENSTKESVGPGAWSWTADDMVGAKGTSTGTAEYDLNLQLALRTEKQLKDMGYKVELTRTSNDVDINNMQRAQIPNTLDADLYVTITSSAAGKKTSGFSAICESSDNPYNFGAYSQCRLLADTLVGSMDEKSDACNNGVEESDDYIGINWCSVPNAILIVGNIKNEADDELLAEEDYQQTVAEGIAAGIDSYFTQK